METLAIKAPDYVNYTLLDGYAWGNQVQNSLTCKLYVDTSIGDWPYVVVARGNANGRYIIKEYCEHDIKTWVYNEAERDQYTAHLKYLRDTEAAQ